MFQGINRPAKRYLYFRFVITYLHCKRSDSLEWVQSVEAKGNLWASPEPYLRQSLLVTLARKISDLYLPENFYESATFLEADGCERRSDAEEQDLAMSLAVRMKQDDSLAQERKHMVGDEEETEEENGDEEDRGEENREEEK